MEGDRPERHLSHDMEPTELGYVALRNLVDGMFERSDREVSRILSRFIGDDSERTSDGL